LCTAILEGNSFLPGSEIEPFLKLCFEVLVGGIVDVGTADDVVNV
jgi:hypothetical protein